ncbi:MULTISPECIES: phosphoribosyltransferase-like protein [unclassified Microbacterium]|uniref:phosphoribosyltransferase-like protein n=1 Tax=unclassified Microbacterium TaxID=2609290 RepID=UPI00301026E9
MLLSDTLWEGNGGREDVNLWLENFTGKTDDVSAEVERLHAVHLLSHFTYFGLRELRELLKALYRDLFRYEVIQEIRDHAKGSTDPAILRAGFDDALSQTRFLGVGNPAESGTHLLYYFRQENRLRKELFPNPYELLSASPQDGRFRIADPEVRRLVFIDDVVGTGRQAAEHNLAFIRHLRDAALLSEQTIEVWYLTLFANPTGLDSVRQLGFDHAAAVHELNASQLAFSEESHAYAAPPAGISRETGRAVAERYGADLAPGNALGYGEGGLMLGLHHNVPDHTLPIFWVQEAYGPWNPMFRRYPKEQNN